MWQLPFHSLTLGLGGPHLPSWRRGVKSSRVLSLLQYTRQFELTERESVLQKRMGSLNWWDSLMNLSLSPHPKKKPKKESWLRNLNAKAFPELCACPAARQTKPAALSLNPQGDCTPTTVETTRPLVLSLHWLPIHYYAAKNTFGGYLRILRTLSSSIASVMRVFLDESGEKIMSNHSSLSVSI